MKIFSAIPAALLLAPIIAKAEIGAALEADYAIYDASGISSYGGQLGISKHTDHGTHYLFGKAFLIEDSNSRNFFGGGSSDMDPTGFGLAYRYGFSFFDDFEPYIEYGWSEISASVNTFDLLGNPASFDSSNAGDYLGVGILYRVFENLHIKSEISYHGLLSDQTIPSLTFDLLGNPKIASTQIEFSARIGVSYQF